jgi:hypothetical protein
VKSEDEKFLLFTYYPLLFTPWAPDEVDRNSS